MNWIGSSSSSTSHGNDKKLKGVRRRKWGKWVSEIRVPGTQERLWLGTYATREAAAVAHDVAVYCLKRPSTLDKLNFPEILSSYCIQQRDHLMSPRSVQKVASDIAMDVDARNIARETTMINESTHHMNENQQVHNVVADDVFWWEGLVDGDDLSLQGVTQVSSQQEDLNISIEDYL
ncbi:ethylene-responsive transcription factor erf020-like protein [Trifolium pratense]|uniref:Ethylene-responsive transcription factor erf020-like protein n=1 Tax=Trifolium pratense TaxID=57577 RepID=A0A2K3M3A0_TRIPR|nr:ethylene-responsive transcription factor erf020-like protein [Trifolium pratense]